MTTETGTSNNSGASDRIFYGVVVAVIALSATAAGGFWFALLMFLAAGVGGLEFVAMCNKKGLSPDNATIGCALSNFFIAAATTSVLSIPNSTAFRMQEVIYVLLVGVIFVSMVMRHSTKPVTIADVGATVLGITYIGWLPSLLVLMRNLTPPGTPADLSAMQQPGFAYVLFTFCCIWSTDTFAYFVGKNFGRNKLCPAVSPKKTIEGALGGLLGAVIASTLFVYAANNYHFAHQPFHFSLPAAALLAATLSVVGQFGDLIESLFKRDAGIKDSGNVIPGHGGMLDRCDSLIVGGAFAYLLFVALEVGLK